MTTPGHTGETPTPRTDRALLVVPGVVPPTVMDLRPYGQVVSADFARTLERELYQHSLARAVANVDLLRAQREVGELRGSYSSCLDKLDDAVRAIEDALGESTAGQWATIKDRFTTSTIAHLQAVAHDHWKDSARGRLLAQQRAGAGGELPLLGTPATHRIRIKAYIRSLMDEMGVTQSELARRMDTSRQYISRILTDGEPVNFTLDHIEQIATALKRRLLITFAEPVAETEHRDPPEETPRIDHTIVEIGGEQYVPIKAARAVQRELDALKHAPLVERREGDTEGRSAEEYRNLYAAYQQLADTHAGVLPDAERYRFLRMNWDRWTGIDWRGTPKEVAAKLDIAVDEAIGFSPANPFAGPNHPPHNLDLHAALTRLQVLLPAHRPTKH